MDLVRRYWSGRIFSEDDSDIDFYREWMSRRVPYDRPSVPSDEVVIELYNLSRQEKFSRILKNPAQYYRVSAPSLRESSDEVLRRVRSVFHTFDSQQGEVEGHENLFFAIVQGFFRHLAKTREWRFSEDMETM